MRKTFLFAVSILGSLYFMPVEIMFVALIGILAAWVLLHENKFKAALFPGAGIYICFLGMGTGIGIYRVCFRDYLPKNVLKDVVYVLFPLLFWFLGKNMGSQKRRCLSSLFLAGTMIAFFDLMHGLSQVFSEWGKEMSLYQFRKVVGAGHPLIMLTLFLYIFMSREILLKRKQVYGCMGILLMDIVIHFSRITILGVCICLLYQKVLRDPVRLFRYGVLLVIGVAAAYGIFPSVFDGFMDRLENSLMEVSYDQETWEHEEIVTNWRGYEVYCEIKKFRNVGMLEKINGGGFGAQLDVGGKAYLVTTEETLPFLHNGYFSTLMIWGVLGCAAYIFLLSVLYLGNRTLVGEGRGLWKALVVIIALDTLFVHGPFFSTGVAGIFLYLGVLGE